MKRFEPRRIMARHLIAPYIRQIFHRQWKIGVVFYGGSGNVNKGFAILFCRYGKSRVGHKPLLIKGARQFGEEDDLMPSEEVNA